MPKFLQSKRIGDYAEKEIENIFSFMGKVTKSKNIEYDLMIDYIKPFSIEIKYDLYAKKSGNIAIEYFNTKQNKPSGINASKADFWVYYLDNDSINIITLTKLIKFTKTEQPHKIVDGGDNNAALMLYKKEHILPSFTNLVGLNNNDIEKIVRKELCLDN